MKAIISRSTEARVPKLLVDLVVHDIFCCLSRTQLHSIVAVFHGFHQILLRREFLSLRPSRPVSGNVATWWKYSMEAVLRQRVRPYHWKSIQKHRSHYRQYKDTYKKCILNPGNTELRLDLARIEDNLPLSSIVMAREQGKIEIRNEDPDRIEIIGGEEKWWNLHRCNPITFQVRHSKPRGIWAQLSQSERQKLTDLRKADRNVSPEKAKKYIEHKVNVTVHHLSGSLFIRGVEIASLSLSQFLGNFETRPAANAFKISARAENLSLEGLAADQIMVPLINVLPITGSSTPNFLRIDFEKNPLMVEADYGVMVNLEKLEVIYHEQAFSQFINFFQGVGFNQNFLKSNLLLLWKRMKKLKKLTDTRQLRVDVNMSVKAPYFVIAECGSNQKSGSVMVVDLGKWTFRMDLQPPLCLDDVTQMELEERLYDRLNINLDGFQVLFSDSEKVWRENLTIDASEYHLISKVRGHVVLSDSIKPEYRLLPKSKLNVVVYNLKMNLSDRRMVMLLNFIEGLPLPSSNILTVNPAELVAEFQDDVVVPDSELNLNYIKNLVITSELSRQRTPDNSECEAPHLGSIAGKWSSVDVSDDDVELWARTVDLPGFDDNISPNNIITSLLRVAVGEIVVVMSRSSDAADRPYIMARISKCRLDTAYMSYGPAVQATIGGFQLIDKLHVGPCGEYLEIVSTQPDVDFISLLYRKVRSDCPDFKTHFHSVEQSLVLDVGVVAVTVHREATLTFTKYLQYLHQKVAHRELMTLAWNWIKPLQEKFQSRDPPIPPGAVKFSYSTHLTEFRLRLCDTELEFLELKMKGFESDCMFKANERMVLRAHLSFISLDDLNQTTNYPKIISVEEDKVLELKYVRHSPRLYNKGLSSEKDDVYTDGSLKLTLERIHLVVVYKMLVDFQHFIEPLISIALIWQITGFLRKSFTSHVNHLRGWNTRLHLSVMLRFPVLLIPQKSESPNLFVLNLGDLSMENFFKGITGCNSKEETVNVIDNILLKLESASLCRATMTLTGRLENQENILEPIHARFDVKRFVGGPVTMLKMDNTNKYREIPLFEIFGNLEPVKISFGQKDLYTFLSVWRDNFGDRRFLESSWWWKSVSPIDGRTPTENDDFFVRKLQVFLSHSDAGRKDTIARFSIDSITIDLYNDIGEDLSSPVRDLNNGLCKLTFWEATVFMEKYYDGNVEMKMALQTCVLEDIRTDSSVVVKKVFHSRQSGVDNFDETISISTPPTVDVTFKQTQTGDRCIDILVEKTRLNLSVSFVAAFAKFAMDSIPIRNNEGGFINHGYVGDFVQQIRASDGLKNLRPPLSNDSTSGYYSSGMSCATDEQNGLSISLQCRKPEVVLFSSGDRKTSAILIRCELLVDWSKHPGRDATVVTMAGLQAWLKSHPHPASIKHKTSVLLNQCDVELARNVKSVDEGVSVTVKLSPIDLRLTVASVATISEIIEELRAINFMDDVKNSNNSTQVSFDLEDLWSPKKISSYCDADICVATEPLLPQQSSFPVGRSTENLTVNVAKIKIVLELPQGLQRRPLFLVKSSFKLSAYDWSSSINMRGELQVQAAYFNEELGVWEPFIEPCKDGLGGSLPWQLVFQVFQGKSFPISPHINFQKEHADNKERKVSNHTDEPEDSATSGDDSDQGMTFLKRQNLDNVTEIKRQNFSLSCSDSTDSENEDGGFEKLKKAVGHLFTGGVSDGEVSESADSSAAEEEEVEEQEIVTEEETCSTRSLAMERAVFLKKHSDSIDSGLETEAVERLAIHVLLYSKDKLEITVTPPSMKVLQELSNAFSGNLSLPVASLSNSNTIKNSIGPGTLVTLLTKSDAPLSVARYDRGDSTPSSPGSFHSNESSSPEIESDFDLVERNPFTEALSPVFQYPRKSIAQLYDQITNNRLLIQVPGFKDLKVVAPNVSSNKLYVLQPSRHQTRYYVVLTTTIEYGFKKFLVRGPLQVQNSTSYAVEVYYKKSVIEAIGEKVVGDVTNPFEDSIRLALIEPDDILDIPLFVAFHCKLYFVPAHISYQISDTGLSWQDMLSDIGVPKDLCCQSKQEDDPMVFSLRAHCEENIKVSNYQKHLPNCTIHLLPPLTVLNCLPYAIEIKLSNIKYEVRIEAGDKTNVYFVNLQKPQKLTIDIPEYLGLHWTGSFSLATDVEEKIVTMVTEQDTDGGNKQLSLSLSITRSPNIRVQVYSSYWIVNNTGLPLQIRGSMIECIHEWSGEGPLLFGFRKPRRRYVRVRAFSSSWSSAFSLDAPGSSGLVICKDKERKRRYRILVQSHLSQISPKLTKIVTLLPNFIVTNSCRKHLRFMEDNERADLWIDIAPGQCFPFWPETESMRMFVKFRDSKYISQHFPITVPHTTVLRMDKGCGITVEVTGSVNQPFSVNFQNYKLGDAPVRIDNQCEDLFLKFHQKESGQVVLLSPYQSLLYTWDDPSKERTLLWNVYNSKGKDFCVPFWKDGFGEERVSFHVVRRGQQVSTETTSNKLSAGRKRQNVKSSSDDYNSSSSSDDSEEGTEKPQLVKKTRRDKIVVYWASYLSDRQRVLLLTQDERLARRIRRTLDAERSHLELFVSMAGVGLSLINKNNHGVPRELSYFSLSDSSAQWEVTVAHKWKTVALELASWMEDKYKQGVPKAQIRDYIHIDFEKMQMTKPFFGEIRRKHRPSVWIQYRRSKHMSLFHFQLHRFQVDNQLHEAEFPTVFCSVSPPNSSSRLNPKPALEIAYLKKYSLTGNDIYKFAKFVVQEHRLQLERPWLSEMCQFCCSWWGEESPSVRIRQDIALVHTPISSIATKNKNPSTHENMFEYLHCSPIKLQVAYSSQDMEQDNKDDFSIPLVDYFLNSLAPSFAQIKQVTVKLLCFEIIGQLCSKNYVWSQALQHFNSQFWQQIHVFVMGINVLTNPYSQYLDFSDDSHPLFYEPYLENTGVPEEFSNGISIGALGLLGHEAGGRSGSATLFAALLGTALQTLIQTEDTKKAVSSQLESHLPHSIIQSFSNFSAVCSLAVSGVVTKNNSATGPIQGVETFFKGPGKGLVGLMTKPSSGVFNCLSMITDGIKRATEMGGSVTCRVKPPRYVNSILGLKPYCDYEARGLALLKLLCKGLYSNDVYWAHAVLPPESKTTLLITLQHIFLIGKYKCWGPYELIWELRMDDLMAVPTVQDDKLIFTFKQEESSPSEWNEEKSVVCTDKSLLQWLKIQIESALVLGMEDKQCA
ncbi:hypothetical protein RUM43_010578 [Polyplax serrata]|uniref:Vacuolar protein sorting-associated protein 13A n=1 Tax=Polyplax serrata TaxID=468196 RepID=A0AAN8P7H7_POLSC